MTYSEQFASVAPPRPPAPASFQRPGPDVLNETIPVVFIGRNRNGFWVVRDAEANFGGLFWRKRAALDFAKANAAPGGYAAVFPQSHVELDMENHGNPLVEYLGTTGRLLTRLSHRLVAVARKLL